MAFMTPTQEKFIIRENILLLDLRMKCFESCLINRINSRGGERLSFSTFSLCGAQEDAEYSSQTFQMQFKEKPAPEEPNSYICSSVYNERGGSERVRNTTVE